MEIIPGIHHIEGTFPNNVYLIVDGGPILVDAALPGNCPRVIRYLDSLGYGRASLKAVVVTHSHIDHIGSVHKIVSVTGAQVWAHYLDAPAIEGKRPSGGFGTFKRGLPHSVSRLAKTRVHRKLTEGDTIECLGGLKVIHTPGHTEGSICLYQAERGILFSGDTIQYSFGRIRKPMGVFCHDSAQVDHSIEKISRLDFEFMLPGEGVPLLGGASEKLRAFLEKKTTNY